MGNAPDARPHDKRAVKHRCKFTRALTGASPGACWKDRGSYRRRFLRQPPGVGIARTPLADLRNQFGGLIRDRLDGLGIAISEIKASESHEKRGFQQRTHRYLWGPGRNPPRPDTQRRFNVPCLPRGCGSGAAERRRPLHSLMAGRIESEAFRDSLPAEVGHSAAPRFLSGGVLGGGDRRARSYGADPPRKGRFVPSKNKIAMSSGEAFCSGQAAPDHDFTVSQSHKISLMKGPVCWGTVPCRNGRRIASSRSIDNHSSGSQNGGNDTQRAESLL